MLKDNKASHVNKFIFLKKFTNLNVIFIIF